MSDSINCFFEQESSLQNICNEMSASSTTFQQEPLLTLHSSTNFNQHNANNSTANTTSVTLVSIPEPPPYDEFVEYTWMPEFSAIFQSEDFGQPQQLLNPEDEKFIFGDFLGNLQEDPNYIFNPILPKNMPVFPSPILDNGCSSSSSKIHNNNNSISTLSLIDHESSLQSPKLINNNNNNLYLPSSSNIPAKRKQNNDDDKSRRRSSIPRLTPINTKLSMSQIHSAPISPPMQISNLSINSIDSNTNTAQKSSKKPHKELLTEEEKRANHIASEQKRRNTIRAGFKELTDIIPTLKNVNNSKSTILFKAIGYIKHLERRNRNLKERAGLLEMRFEMEMRQGVAPMSLGNNTYGVIQNSLNNLNGMTTITTIPPQPQSSRLSLSMTISDHHHVTHDFHPHIITHHRPSHHPMQNLHFVPSNADILSQQTITTPNNN
ncbi:9696_t:CDS:2 [Entrophospora sp. SA101]|nr:9696_t:CDS:2 [Entrophospora sp. SA101]